MGYEMKKTRAIRPLLSVGAALLVTVAAVPARAQEIPTGAWSGISSYDPLGGSFEMGASASDGTHLYIIGGLQDGAMPDNQQQVRRYDPVTDAWETLAPLPFTLTDSVAAIHNGVIYLFGGTTSSGPTNAIHAYTIAGGATAAVGSFPTSRNLQAAAKLGDLIYVSGGSESGLLLDTLDVFDPADSSLTSLPAMPAILMMHSMTASGGRLYVMGGLGVSGASAQTFEFTPGPSGGWATLNPMFTDGVSQPRYAAASFDLQNRVYIAGGASDTGTRDTTLEFNPATNTWARRQNMSVAREFHGGGAINGAGYVYGSFGAPTGETFAAPDFSTPPPTPNQPPTANAGPDQTVEATSPAGASVTLNGFSSSDSDGTVVNFAWTGPFGSASGPGPTVGLAVGAHTITLTVTDDDGATASDTVLVTVVDTAPPSDVTIKADPSVIKKANGDFKKVKIKVTAADGSRPHAQIVSVASNQPAGSKPDWKIMGSLKVKLRAKCTNNEERIYTITVRITDESGNSSLSSVDVRVLPKVKNHDDDDDDDDDDGDDD